jgi:hypothetical protein
MFGRKMWLAVGGGLALSAAVIAQYGFGQSGTTPPPPFSLPTRTEPGVLVPPPSTAPSLPIATPPQSPLHTPPPPASLPTPPLTPPAMPPGIGTSSPSSLPPDIIMPIGKPAPIPPGAMPSAPSIPVAPPITTPVPTGPTTLVDPTAPPPISTVPLPATTTVNRLPELGVPDTRPGKQDPSVSIEWIAPASSRFNQPTVCQIVVRNNGQTPVHQVTVKPNLPAEAKIKISEPPIDPNNNDWSLGSLAPGQMKKIDVTVVSTRRGYQTYTANVTFAAHSVHLTEVREPLLQLKVKGPDRGMVGEQMPITFAVHNPGDGSTDNVKVRAVLPETLDHPRGQTFEIEVGNLAPKETRTLQLACIGKSAGKMKASLLGF